MLETEEDAAVLRIFLAQVESQDSAIEGPRALDVRDAQQNMADSFEYHRGKTGSARLISLASREPRTRLGYPFD
jgi:hypothetical protein